ncbi:MAG: CapA family protein [Methanobrevibacter sp.]|uniref:CapA family protein n=1 Tax=Methanobrevibacter sp. TaxID=66852 RepID=UPI0025F04AE3|nr:CapA family protein [Methanobrevibacter sp.]MBQ2613298.1 CapA family protein [Methanobrevibacter sp.]MEE0024156.1 CapA family protein [Methanobrevibacter sp.]MEE0901463.1 CapA family protein [Methanobrevibacter sp.]
MNFRKFSFVLVVVLAVLLLIAAVATIFMGGGSNFGQPKGDVSIAVTGDVMFARNMEGVLSSDSSPFAGVSNVTSNVDLLIINFENAATNSENAVKGDVPLKCDPKYVPLAKANNRTIATLANNHVCDYGFTGMRDTIKYLKDAGITPMGAGENASDAHKSVTQNINNRDITVLNYMDSNNFAEYDYQSLPYANDSSPGYSAYNSEDAKKQISEARANGSDFIMVSMHFGNEYSMSPNTDQEKIAHELIDYGADIVVGAHPHVPQGVEMYKGKPICYSLGNFMFDLGTESTLNDYMIKVELVNDTGVLTLYPVNINGYLPHIMSPDDGKTFLNGLSPQCKELNITDDGTGKLTFNLTKDK